MCVLLHTVSIAKLWNQPKCPSSGVRADKTGCMYTMEYYLIIKRNEIKSLAEKSMELKIIMLSKIKQAHNDKDHMIL